MSSRPSTSFDTNIVSPTIRSTARSRSMRRLVDFDQTIPDIHYEKNE